MKPSVVCFQAIDVVFELTILGVDRFDVRVDVGFSAAGEKRDCTNKYESDAQRYLAWRERISLACASG